MAKHAFGILREPPQRGVLYEDYTPEKYDCIWIDDDLIEPLAARLDTPLYWHGLDRKARGLAYCGITLIPPEAMDSVLDALDKSEGFLPLKRLLTEAKRQGNFIIHFGI